MEIGLQSVKCKNVKRKNQKWGGGGCNNTPTPFRRRGLIKARNACRVSSINENRGYYDFSALFKRNTRICSFVSRVSIFGIPISQKNRQRSFHRKTLPISNKVVLLKMNFDKLQNFCFYLVLTQFSERNEKK